MLARGCAKVTRKTLGDDNFDSTKKFPSLPVRLLQDLLVKLRESEMVLISFLVHLCGSNVTVCGIEAASKWQDIRALVSELNVSTETRGLVWRLTYQLLVAKT